MIPRLVSLGVILACLIACGRRASLPPTAGSNRTAQLTPAEVLPPTLEAGQSIPLPDEEISPEQPLPGKQQTCPDLESSLYQLTQAADPVELARQLGFTVRDTRIQVVLILAQADVGFLQNFDVEIGTQVGTEVQVFAPIDQLCALANTPEVLAVQAPARAFPQ